MLKVVVGVNQEAPDLAAGVNFDRFKHEILLTAQLQHPHILPVFTSGETEGLPYYTMPFVEGESLRVHLMRAGAMPIAVTVSILRDVARALEFAHANGVVHRDIKPDNILLAGNTATVSDFGIAKALLASAHASHAVTVAADVGLVIGTPLYMAPAAETGLDHRVDLYALGCCVLEAFDVHERFFDFEFFRQQGHTDDDSYANAGRVFRGSTADGGPFTKDLAYSKGFILIYNYILLAVRKGLQNRIALLFCGKTTLEDMRTLAQLVEEGIVVPPKYLPPLFADLPAVPMQADIPEELLPSVLRGAAGGVRSDRDLLRAVRAGARFGEARDRCLAGLDPRDRRPFPDVQGADALLHHPGVAVDAHPPQAAPVLVVPVDQQADPGFGADVRQPLQRPAAFGLLVDHQPDGVPLPGEDHGDDTGHAGLGRAGRVDPAGALPRAGGDDPGPGRTSDRGRGPPRPVGRPGPVDRRPGGLPAGVGRVPGTHAGRGPGRGRLGCATWSYDT